MLSRLRKYTSMPPLFRRRSINGCICMQLDDGSVRSYIWTFWTKGRAFVRPKSPTVRPTLDLCLFPKCRRPAGRQLASSWDGMGNGRKGGQSLKILKVCFLNRVQFLRTIHPSKKMHEEEK